MAQTQDKYVLRLPDGLRDSIRTDAERNGRSMNAEIIHRLGEKQTAEVRKNSEGFMLRMPDGMRDALKSEAERNGRSLNAEICHRLGGNTAANNVDYGGPAFPTEPNTQRGFYKHHGMSLRDWFAGQALACCMDGRDRRQAARTCYELADAMLAAREVKP